MHSDVHFELCARFVVALKDLFIDDRDAYPGGDQAFYWNPKTDGDRLAPDAYLIRGAGKTPRSSWKLWEEKTAYPAFSIRFVLEVWSESHKLAERRRKQRRYEDLGATEFFELDSLTGDFAGQRLINGRYDVIEPADAGRLTSLELNAELAFEGGQLRLYRNGQKILTAVELRAELERVG